MHWLTEVEMEMKRGANAAREGNAGKVRTCARRAAGQALMALQKALPEYQYGPDFLRCLRTCMSDERLPDAVRAAAQRLQQSLAQDFSSSSSDPLNDAQIIVTHVQSLLSTTK